MGCINEDSQRHDGSAQIWRGLERDDRGPCGSVGCRPHLIVQLLITQGPKEHPLLFILDGAGSHIDMSAVDFAIDNGMSVLLLPANLTHKLQVADVAVFGPLKTVFAEREQGRAQADSLETETSCLCSGGVESSSHTSKYHCWVPQDWNSSLRPRSVEADEH